MAKGKVCVLKGFSWLVVGFDESMMDQDGFFCESLVSI